MQNFHERAEHLERILRVPLEKQLERQVFEERWGWLDEFYGPEPVARRVSFSSEPPAVEMIEVDLSSFNVEQPWRELKMGDGAIVAARQQRTDLLIKRAEELESGTGRLTCESKLAAHWVPSPNPKDGGLMRPYYYNEDSGLSAWCNCSKRTLSAVEGKHCQGSCRLVARGGARQSTVKDMQDRYLKAVC